MKRELSPVSVRALLSALFAPTLLLASCGGGGGEAPGNPPAHNSAPANVATSQPVDANQPNIPNGNAAANVNGAVANVTATPAPPDFKCETPAPSVAPNPAKTYRLATNLVNAMKSVETVQATMRVTTCYEQVRRTYDLQGEVRYRGDGGPDAVFVQYTGGRKNGMRLLDETVEFYQPRLNQVTRMSNQTAEGKYYGSYYYRYKPRMKSAARTYIGDEQVDGARTAILKLTPKQPDRFKTVYI